MSAKPWKTGATEADWDALPEDSLAELVDGDLYLHARPRTRHASAIINLVLELGSAMRDRPPKGWWVLFDVAIRFGKNRILVPDLVGWRRDRMAKIPDVVKLEAMPDWVCEGISPSTAHLDRGRKREIYAAANVGHLWFADPKNRTLEILQLDGRSYRLVATAGGNERGKFAPFDHVIDLGVLWRDVEHEDDH